MRYLLRTAIMTAALAAPYFLVDFGRASVLSLIIGIAHIVGAVVEGHIVFRAVPKSPARVSLLLGALHAAVPAMTVGLVLGAIFLWVGLAYKYETPSAGFLIVPLLFSAVLILAPALFLTLARPRPDGGEASDLLAVTRRNRFAPFWESWIFGQADLNALLMLIAVCAAMQFSGPFAWVATGDAAPSLWKMALHFPLFPLTLIAAAALLALARSFHTPPAGAYLAPHAETAEGPKPAQTRKLAWGAASVLAGFGMVVFLALHLVHLTVVAAMSSGPGAMAIVAAYQSVDKWADQQRDGGATGIQMATMLNNNGRWTVPAPETGLSALLVDLKGAVPARYRKVLGKCDIAVEAGWLLSNNKTDLRYCIRASCPSPAAWNAPPSVSLYSSHAGAGKGWANGFFIDVFARGGPEEPGGYCTADGRLSERFHGGSKRDETAVP